MKALVVGGGISGPATAVALRALGWDVTVLEARPEPTGEAGSWLTLAPNGLDALDGLGLLTAARAVGMPSRQNVMLGATGRRLGSISLGTPLADGTVALTVKRSRLAAALADEARRRGVPVRHSAKVVSVSTTATSATATLTDGTSHTADLVVGADGVHSRIRTSIDPAAPKPRYVGLANFGGITRGTDLAASLQEESWTFTFGRRAFFGAQPTPDGDVLWFVNVPRPEITRAERESTTTAQWQAQLGELLRGDAGPGRELVTTGLLELAGDNTYDLGHVPTWHRGRLVILGDAAHAPSPSSGQGASMALEDAVALASSMHEAPTVGAGLASFEAARRERVERVVALGARTSSSKVPGPVGRVVLEAVMRLVFRHLVTDARQEWLTGHRGPRLDGVRPA